MSYVPHRKPRGLQRVVALALGLCLSLAGATSVAAASLAGPSIGKRAETTKLVGQGFAPRSALSVSVVAPDGSEAHYSTLSNASGAMTYRLRPSMSGPHRITVLDSGGRALSSTVVNVID